MYTIQKEKQVKLVDALKKIPKQNEIEIKVYLDQLLLDLNDFRYEIEWNINFNNSYTFSIDYLKQLIDEYTIMYMTVEGTMDIILFPDILKLNELINVNQLKTSEDVHKHIYLKTISMLTNTEKFMLLKIQNRIPIIEKEVRSSRKYIVKDNCILNLIEVAYSMFHTDIFFDINGEEIQLYQFIYQFGIFAGVEIKNIPQRIQEMKDRGKPYKYIERMLIMLKKKINVID